MKHASAIAKALGLIPLILGGIVGINLLIPQRLRLSQQGFAVVIIDLTTALLLAIGLLVMAISVFGSVLVAHFHKHLLLSGTLLLISYSTTVLILVLLTKRRRLVN